MKIELKEIVQQLSELLNLPEDERVSACFDGDKLVGWNVVYVAEDGTITPTFDEIYPSIAELYEYEYCDPEIDY